MDVQGHQKVTTDVVSSERGEVFVHSLNNSQCVCVVNAPPYTDMQDTRQDVGKLKISTTQ